VLFMIAVPYAVLAGMIGLIWRSCKAADRRAAQLLAGVAPQPNSPVTS
jgi:hypothetical protein